MKKINLQSVSKVVPLSDGFLLALISYEDLTTEEDKRRNLFKIDSNGAVYWQVGNYIATQASTFTNVVLRDQQIWAYNFEGGLYRIDQASGAILSSELCK